MRVDPSASLAVTLIRERRFGLARLAEPCPPRCRQTDAQCPAVDRVTTGIPPASADPYARGQENPLRPLPPVTLSPGDAHEVAPGGAPPCHARSPGRAHTRAPAVVANTAAGTLLDVFA